MNVKRLTYLIQSPHSISESDLNDLKQLKENFSYCSTYHVLYLMGLSMLNHIMFDEELKRNSINTNDRIRLFNLLNQNLPENTQKNQKDKIEKESNEQVDSREFNEDINFIDLNPSEIQITEEPELKTNVSIEDSELEAEVLSHIVETFFEKEIKSSINITLNSELPTEIEIKDNLESNKINIKDLSFSEWLKYKQGKISIVNKEIKTDEPKLTKKEIDKLLNKFIEEEPKISRPKKEFFNPVKNAKHSLDESTVLVSETLAKIYWMQKNYDKAIKAYEQLSLQNPKKSVFFANQIKKIKKEINLK